MIASRKRRRTADMEAKTKVKNGPKRPKFEDAPPVNSIRDLIELGRTIKFYRNVDTVMLWRITPYLEELDRMVGMESLKETLFYQVIYYLQGMQNKNGNDEYLHTVIYGPPGTGKTTVAHIIGKIYQALNVLSPGGPFKIAHRDDLVAGYLGQTATKTKKLLQSCLGGVLFIDEVYALGPRNNDKDSFAKEAIDTLNAFLSEHKNDFCCIIAGYEEEVANCFFSMNRGLERRFPWVHRIPSYGSKELYQILLKMLRESSWQCDADEKAILELLEQNKDLFKNAGGDIETFLTKCRMFHSKRVFSLPIEAKFILTLEDVNSALEFLRKNNTVKTDGPPEHMYI